jgi:hypothetical protein
MCSPKIGSVYYLFINLLIYLLIFARNTKRERLPYIVSIDLVGFIDRFLVLATLFQLHMSLSVEC